MSRCCVLGKGFSGLCCIGDHLLGLALLEVSLSFSVIFAATWLGYTPVRVCLEFAAVLTGLESTSHLMIGHLQLDCCLAIALELHWLLTCFRVCCECSLLLAYQWTIPNGASPTATDICVDPTGTQIDHSVPMIEYMSTN